MGLLITIKEPQISLVTKGEMTNILVKSLEKDTWLFLLSVEDEPIRIRISSINMIQEISEEKRKQLELDTKVKIIQKPNFIIPKKREN